MPVNGGFMLRLLFFGANSRQTKAKGKTWGGQFWTLLTKFKKCKNNSIDNNGNSLKIDKVNTILTDVRKGAGLDGTVADNFF